MNIPHQIARWRHLALGGADKKDLLLCDNSLAIEPCFEAETKDVHWSIDWAEVELHHAKVRDPEDRTGKTVEFWYGFYTVGDIATGEDRYIVKHKAYIHKSLGLSLMGESLSAPSKHHLGTETHFTAVEALQVRVSYAFAYAGSGKKKHPNATPSDYSKIIDIGRVEKNTILPDGMILGNPITSGRVTVKSIPNGGFEITGGDSGFWTQYDVYAKAYVKVIELPAPTVTIKKEEGVDKVIYYTAVDDDDDY